MSTASVLTPLPVLIPMLGAAPEREAVARAISSQNAEEIETAIAAEGGAAAKMRTRAEWAAHPQGIAVASEPLVAGAESDQPFFVGFGFLLFRGFICLLGFFGFGLRFLGSNWNRWFGSGLKQ